MNRSPNIVIWLIDIGYVASRPTQVNVGFFQRFAMNDLDEKPLVIESLRWNGLEVFSVSILLFSTELNSVAKLLDAVKHAISNRAFSKQQRTRVCSEKWSKSCFFCESEFAAEGSGVI
ncbi:MAG: hypothetical protein EAZ42_04555 [Verrucomicrobia bacterium]|nr:MAG: hypothetical protein EAZ42_04555 [Verrucomicrobiota bacterium]